MFSNESRVGSGQFSVEVEFAGAGDLYVDQFANEWAATAEMHFLKFAAAAYAGCADLSVDENFKRLTDVSGVFLCGDFFEEGVEAVPAGIFGCGGNIIFKAFLRVGAFAVGIAGDETKIPPEFFVHAVGIFEFFVGFAAKANDDVGGNGAVWNGGLNFSHDGFVFLHIVIAVHAAEHAVVSGLDGHVDIRADGFELGKGGNKFVGKIAGGRRGEAEATKAFPIERIESAKQGGEGRFSELGELAGFAIGEAETV